MPHHRGDKASVVSQSTPACDLINKCQPRFEDPTLVAKQRENIQEIVNAGTHIGDFQP